MIRVNSCLFAVGPCYRLLLRFYVLLAVIWTIASAEVSADNRVKLPVGFELTQVATDELATNIFCMIALPDGNALVSGPGYIKRLIDSDADGVFDRAELISGFPKSGAQGLAVDGEDLLCVGDEGIWRLPDALKDGVDGEDQSERPPVLLFQISTRGEHHAHSIQKGPDGWWYHIAGNDSVFDESSCDGPIRKRRAGVIMRFSPDFSQRQIVAHGFRNAYDFAFNSTDQLFTFDSDGERDLGLPWYRPTRVFEIVPGDDAGWVSWTWKRPSYYFDMPRLIGDAGRASPTGVVCYDGQQFPVEYDDGIFLGDWTFGRVLVCRREWKTGNYLPPKDFLTPKHSFGFPVTDLDVANDGSLLVSVGGRGTEGGVWRISSTKTRAKSDESLGEYVWKPRKAYRVAGSIESDVSDALARLDDATEASSSHVDALSRLVIHADSLSPVAHGKDVTTRLSEILKSNDPQVISSAYTLVRSLSERESWRKFWWTQAESGNLEYRLFTVFSIVTAKTDTERSIVFKSLFDAGAPFSRTPVDQYFPDEIAARLGLILFSGVGRKGGFFSSTTANRPISWSDSQRHNARRLLMRSINNASSHNAKKELVRIAAAQHLSANKFRMFILEQISSDSLVNEDLYWISCLVQLQPYRKGEAELVMKRLASTLLQIRYKARRQGVDTDSHWNPMLAQLTRKAIDKFPALRSQFMNAWAFGSRDHGFLFEAFTDEDMVLQQKRIADWVQRNPSIATANHVRALLVSPNARVVEVLRSLSEQQSLRDAVTLALAEHGDSKDRELFVNGLQSLDPNVQKQSAIALRKLVPEVAPDTAAIALQAAMRLGNEKQDVSIRDQLILLLRKFAKQDFGYQLKQPDLRQRDVLQKWRDYLLATHPDLAAKLEPAESSQQLLARLEKLDWDLGDPTRGKFVYENLQCASCHGASRALGPRLEGVTKRMSKTDLLTAIVNPDAQVSDRYRTTLFETVDGLLHSGSVIYQNVDGVTIREASGRTVRLNQDQIETQRRSAKSLMPTGLFDRATDQEVVDLMAWLETL